ncbi:aminodeoxychorismate synthase component I [Paenibacillus yanchengensis]|uniref:Aminodeoxychorismate synthase component I n=1 Tax=Paenibacillus yanchengensis TaxID=2035833 RepID=A0ABW4YMC4_9BACL
MLKNLLIFDFPNKEGENEPIYFINPIKVISTYNIDEVNQALLDVENFLESGFYVAGYLSYEAATAFDAAMTVKKDYKMPLLWFAVYQEPHYGNYLSGKKTNYSVSPWKSNVPRNTYDNNISKIKYAISNGETYQVNYSIRLTSKFSGDDISYYYNLAKAQKAQYSAYLNIDRFRILSSSPELFFRWDGNKIITRPMKGTYKRGRWPEEDMLHEKQLKHSEKNQAENLMIVDLVRNDLGRISEVGSVDVSSLFEIERYPNVFQMTSTVSATTKPNTTLADVFKALFPCGSVTGAPKISTMKKIASLEDSAREVYCGAIGFIKPNKESVFNVPIRTVWIDTETGIANYGVGGGVIWDSEAEDEYSELLAKASLLESIIHT